MEGKGKTGKQGFASMDPERRKELARLAGQTAHRLGKAHTFTPEEVQKGSQKGGRAVSRNRAHMAEIGRKGGLKLRRRRAKVTDDNGKET